MAFNFKFSKTKGPSKLLPKKTFVDQEEKTESKPEFVTSIEDNEIKTTAPVEEKKGPLVIPLIQNNNWRAHAKRKAEAVDKEDGPNSLPSTAPKVEVDRKEGQSSDSLEEKAKRELLSEAKAFSEKEETDSKRVIPILLTNKVPDGFEEEGNFDVSIRPAAPSSEDYERVPVGEFGWAMLRGMGFDEKKAQSVAPVEVKIRPKGLGLGADLMPPEKKTREEKK